MCVFCIYSFSELKKIVEVLTMSQHATPTPEAINTMNSPSTSPKKGKSESPKPSSTRSVSPSPYNNSNNNNVKHEVDILSLQKELQDKQHELTIAYQTSLELVETNTELQNQLDEQTITIQQLDASITDYETKVSHHQYLIVLNNEPLNVDDMML